MLRKCSGGSETSNLRGPIPAQAPTGEPRIPVVAQQTENRLIFEQKK